MAAQQQGSWKSQPSGQNYMVSPKNNIASLVTATTTSMTANTAMPPSLMSNTWSPMAGTMNEFSQMQQPPPPISQSQQQQQQQQLLLQQNYFPNFDGGIGATAAGHSQIEEESNDSSNLNNYSGDQYHAEQHRQYLQSHQQHYQNQINNQQNRGAPLRQFNNNNNNNSNRRGVPPLDADDIYDAGDAENDDEEDHNAYRIQRQTQHQNLKEEQDEDDEDDEGDDDFADYQRYANQPVGGGHQQLHGQMMMPIGKHGQQQQINQQQFSTKQLHASNQQQQYQQQNSHNAMYHSLSRIQEDHIQGQSNVDDSLVSEINEHLEIEGFEDLFPTIAKDFKDNRVNEALDISIYNAQRVKGPASFLRLFSQILKFLNNEAVNSLNADQFEKSLFILIKCKQFTELPLSLPPKLRALTFNNFGCYYRKLNQLPKALGYLEQALRFLNSVKSQDYLGMTYLNIAAVLSQMGEHFAALENAKKAVVEIHKEYQTYLNRKTYEEAFKEPEFIDLSQSLAIAFYNIGVEQEHFQNYEVSLINYGKACEVADDNLGASHRLTIRFKKLFHEFNLKLQKSEKQKMQLQQRIMSGQRKGRIIVTTGTTTTSSKAAFANHSKTQPVAGKTMPRHVNSKSTIIARGSATTAAAAATSGSNGFGMSLSQSHLDDKILPFTQSYGVQQNEFTQSGRNVIFKSKLPPQINTQTSAVGSRPSTASRLGSSSRGSTPMIIVSRPTSAFGGKPIPPRSLNGIRPVSAMISPTASATSPMAGSVTPGGMTSNPSSFMRSTLPVRFAGAGHNRPQSAYINANDVNRPLGAAAGFASPLQQANSKQMWKGGVGANSHGFIRPGKAKQQQQLHGRNELKSQLKSQQKQDIFDWEEDSPMNMSNLENDEVIQKNQRLFLQSISDEAEAQISNLRAEESAIRTRIEQLKLDHERAVEQALILAKEKRDEEDRIAAANRAEQERIQKQELNALREAKRIELEEIQKLRQLRLSHQQQLQIPLNQLSSNQIDPLKSVQQIPAMEDDSPIAKVQEAIDYEDEDRNMFVGMNENPNQSQNSATTGLMNPNRRSSLNPTSQEPGSEDNLVQSSNSHNEKQIRSEPTTAVASAAAAAIARSEENEKKQRNVTMIQQYVRMKLRIAYIRQKLKSINPDRKRVLTRIFTYNDYQLLLIIYAKNARFELEIISLNPTRQQHSLPRIYSIQPALAEFIQLIVKDDQLDCFLGFTKEVTQQMSIENPFLNGLITLTPQNRSFTMNIDAQLVAEIEASSKIQLFVRNRKACRSRRSVKHVVIQQFALDSNDEAHIFTMFFNPQGERAKTDGTNNHQFNKRPSSYIATLENLRTKPHRFFSKLTLPKLISERLLDDFHQGTLDPFLYFQRNENRLEFTETSRSITAFIIQTHFRSTFSDIFNQIAARKTTSLTSTLRSIEVSLRRDSRESVRFGVRALITVIQRGLSVEGSPSGRDIINQSKIEQQKILLDVNGTFFKQELLQQIRSGTFSFNEWFEYNEKTCILEMIYDHDKHALFMQARLQKIQLRKYQQQQNGASKQQDGKSELNEAGATLIGAEATVAVVVSVPKKNPPMIQIMYASDPKLSPDNTKRKVSSNPMSDGDESEEEKKVDKGAKKDTEKELIQLEAPPDLQEYSNRNRENSVIRRNAQKRSWKKEQETIDPILVDNSVRTLQRVWRDTTIIKKQSFSLRTTDKDGLIIFVEGECHFVRKCRNRYSVQLWRSVDLLELQREESFPQEPLVAGEYGYRLQSEWQTLLQ